MLKQQHIYFLKPSDTASDIPFTFQTPQGTCSIEINLHFEPPSEWNHTICRQPVMQALNTYYVGNQTAFSEDQWMEYLPIKNMITVSLDHGNKYLGNAHRWDSNQTHLFTPTYVAQGFLKPESLCGCWSGMLHIHEIISPQCRVELKIGWEVCDELDAV